LQLAELALVKDSSETNLGRLKDNQAQLSALGGIEAAREGFGVLPGLAPPVNKGAGTNLMADGR
jgi:hypothetical protein